MSDDLDDQLRAAMKVLDDEVPSGYFDALPQRTLARLESTDEMQSSGMDTNQMNDNDSASGGVPPMADANRDDDSGLHDIRSLASSTKLRMSKRLASVPPPIDSDILASSSAGWKNVALPEPARMVSLPDVSQLPSVAELKAQQKAEKASRKSGKDLAPVIPEATPVAAADSPSKAAVVTPVIGARFAKPAPRAGNRTTLYAGLGIAVAAAAVVVIFVKMSGSQPAPAPQQVAAAAPSAVAVRALPVPASVVATATPIEPAPAPSPVAAAVLAEPPATVATDEPDHHKAERSGAAKKPAGAVAFSGDDLDKATAKPEKSAKGTPAVGAGSASSSDPSFDALLKEAGVQDKKPTAPVLTKKSLSSGDIRTAMGTVDAKAKACYSGTQGSASVKLTVAPSGTITKVAIHGVFAGTPTAACVEAAVRDAKFPPWDGGPQSVSYAYLLAE